MTREELQSAIQDFWDEKFNHSKHPEISDESKIIAFECMIDEAKRRSTQPPTNADRIRAMDDKELTEFLSTKLNDDFYGCPDLILQWLQQPAEEADHESNSEP